MFVSIVDTIKTTAVLFSFDEVIMDTEVRCFFFWHKAGVDYLGMDDLENRMGSWTLTHIYDTFLGGRAEEQEEITTALIRSEQEIDYDYIPGVLDFIVNLRRNHAQMAVVTSSNDQRMAAVYRARPEVRTMLGHVLTVEMFARSRPTPDCFLLGMEVLGTTSDTTYAFEDSFNRLKAGVTPGTIVIGLAMTNPRESIAPLCHCVLDDSKGFAYDRMLQVHE